MDYKYMAAFVCLAMFSAALGSSTLPNEAEACVNGATISLTFDFYLSSCPEAEAIVFSWVEKAVSDDPRMAASLLRLHFHDCFVNGCDASVLLDDTASMVGEKSAAPNANSLRGFDVIDAIKAEIEYFCPQTVSCADILAIAARDAVVLSGGPGWEVEMGRKDSLIASKAAANNNIPSPNSDLPTLLSKFQALGLSLQDLLALSGAHTMGKARCSTFSARLNGGGPDINLEFLQSLQQLCASNTTLADLDHATPMTFDNRYFTNILSGEGLLPSDQALVGGVDEARALVQSYALDARVFYRDFAKSMIVMGGLQSAAAGEIRRNCRAVNQILP
ncbi:peroxidase 40-like [Salvia splendens]|uniref:peroxidase 40-like n=1 Tax=Salvia splendens TaxID=180675 RepID=UPI001C251B32|nr:peroxidase 40-like [Salvia splendens]